MDKAKCKAELSRLLMELTLFEASACAVAQAICDCFKNLEKLRQTAREEVERLAKE